MAGRPKGNQKYTTAKLYEQAKEAIEKHNLFFINDIVAFLPCSKMTFYLHFPADSEKHQELSEMLEVNKTKTKSAIRAKLFKGNKASELLALYRLIATTEEHQKLNQSYIDHTTNGKDMNIPISKWANEDE